LCQLCNIERPIEDFTILYQRKDNGLVYRRHECVECRKQVNKRPDQKEKAASRKYRYDRSAKGWEAKSKWRFKREYGISVEDARHLLSAQDGRCANIACCKQIEFGVKDRKKIAVIDHCHKTGRVRGVMCDMCNKTMGMSADNPAILMGLANYLRRYA
jgi:hypothetical protein